MAEKPRSLHAWKASTCWRSLRLPYAVLLLLLGVGATLAYQLVGRHETTAVSAELLHDVDRDAAELNTRLERVAWLALLLRRRLEHSAELPDPDFDIAARDLLRLTPLLSRINLVPATGPARTYPATGTVPSYADLQLLADATPNGLSEAAQVVWSDPYQVGSEPAPRVSCVVPVHRDAKLVAVLALDLSTTHLLGEDRSGPVGTAGAYAMLVGPGGSVIAAPPTARSDWGLPEAAAPGAALLQASGPIAEVLGRTAGARSGVQSIVHRPPELLAWSRLPTTGWTLLVVTPTGPKPGLGGWPALLLGWTLGGCLLAALLLWWHSRRLADALTLPFRALQRWVLNANEHARPAGTALPAITEVQDVVRHLTAVEHLLHERDTILEDTRRQLDAQFELKQSLVDTVPVPMYYTDPAGALVGCNKAFEEFFGVSKEQLIGLPVDQTVSLSITDSKAAASGAGHKTIEGQLAHTDGTTRDVVLHAAPMNNPDDTFSGLVGVVFDITERKQAEREAAWARDKALEGSRLKSEFLASVSHEIRTPMNGVIGMTELLLETSLDEDQRRYTRTVQDSATALLRIIDDILDFSKLEAGKVEFLEEEFEPRGLVEAVQRTIVVPAGEKGLVIETFTAPDLPGRMLGDMGRLRQILVNLAGNALKFTERGKISVEATVDQHGKARSRIRFAVADTGVGIAADVRPLIFQPFTQVDGSSSRRFGGTGLGLSICKRLVESMGGQIGFDSECGVGSTFWFVVPLKHAMGRAHLAGASGSGAPNASAQEGVGRGRILFAEDNPVNLAVGIAALKKLGHEVSTAANGEEAVELARSRRFDLILMDVQMPKMDGVQAMKAIRQQEASGDHHAIIVAVTANAMKGDRERYLDAGMDDYLAKPYRPVELRAVVEKWLS